MLVAWVMMMKEKLSVRDAQERHPSETYLSRKDVVDLTRSLINAALQRLGDNYTSGKFVENRHADAGPLQATIG